MALVRNCNCQKLMEFAKIWGNYLLEAELEVEARDSCQQEQNMATCHLLGELKMQQMLKMETIWT